MIVGAFLFLFTGFGIFAIGFSHCHNHCVSHCSQVFTGDGAMPTVSEVSISVRDIRGIVVLKHHVPDPECLWVFKDSDR